ncbi:MAG: alkaline phosphatase family protein [Micrococcales bacterium]
MTTMLPALPRTFGRLSDVFVSSLGSITGLDNRLSFRRAKQVCAILVDGLGSHNLKAAAGHAPFLNASMAASGTTISCGFPATTATSITSFATGVSAGQHGLIGYQIFDRESDSYLNMLSGWSDSFKPGDWQVSKTVSEVAGEKGVGVFFVGPPEYEGTGFTNATMPAAQYLGAKTISDRVDRALELMNARSDALVYLYVPELDQAAHAKGSGSTFWLEKVEELDWQMKRLASALPKTAGAVLVADHGVIDVHQDHHIYLDDLSFEWERVQAIAGDPRVAYLYLKDRSVGELANAKARLQTELGAAALVLGATEMVEGGLFGSLNQDLMSRFPDLAVLAMTTVAFYHRGFAKPQSLKMIGQHGSLSHTELMIPMIRFGALN